MLKSRSIADAGKRSADRATGHKRSRHFHNLVTWFLLRAGIDEGLKLSPWASLAKVACFKEHTMVDPYSGPKGRGLGLDSCLACPPVVPIL